MRKELTEKYQAGDLSSQHFPFSVEFLDFFMANKGCFKEAKGVTFLNKQILSFL